MILPQPNAAFAWAPSAARWGLVCGPLEPLARHIFTNKSWLLGWSVAAEGWREVAEAVGTDPGRLLRVHQVHGTEVLVHVAGRPPASAAADIIAGNDASIALAIQTADCVPLLIADRRTGAVAAAHAGWRGTALRVAAAAIKAMTAQFGSHPRDLLAAIGPSIGPCCYQVGAEVREHFVHAAFPDAELTRWFADGPAHLPTNPTLADLSNQGPPGALFLNLWTATRDQLEAAGVPRAQIFAAELCTASHAQAFCSYRREGRHTGRLAAVIRQLEVRSSNFEV